MSVGLFEFLCIVVGILLLTSVYASILSNKFGVPSLLLFLLIGMLSGSEGLGGIHFENYVAANAIGNVALIFILFSGGLGTQWQRIRPVIGQGLVLSTVGVVLTMVIFGTFTWFILGSFSSFAIGFNGISWGEGLLLGAIVSSTDAAAVFSVLRTSNLELKGNLQPLLELESGSNDPMAVLLTTTLVSTLTAANASAVELLSTFLLQFGVGAAVGIGGGYVMSWFANRLHLDTKALYPVLMMARALLIYGIAAALQGNGFLAVYLAGVVFGNRPLRQKQSIVEFHEGIAWLMQIVMFLVLGLLVFPSQLLAIAPIAVALALCLMFVARPLSVLLSMVLTKYLPPEKLFISWVGLRGAVPIILAIAPIAAGIQDARVIFNVVFFIVLVSVTIQGFTLAPVARSLKLAK
ncbi:MAG: potassium/proton antiporter [Synechococcus sp.]